MENSKKVLLNIHSVYSIAGGKNVHGGFGFATPEKIGILDSVLVSPDGKHKAVFSHEKHRGRYCNIRVTHGPHRGLSGDLDATSREITQKSATSGWFFWRPETLPEYAEKHVAYLEETKAESKKVKASLQRPVAKVDSE